MLVHTLCLNCSGDVFTKPSRAKIGRGKFCSQACYWEYGRPEMTGDKHWLWKGQQVGYAALHSWVKRHLGTPRVCENCGTTEAVRYEWANISGEYKRDLSDWARLCSVCHHSIDNITIRGWQTRRRG